MTKSEMPPKRPTGTAKASATGKSVPIFLVFIYLFFIIYSERKVFDYFILFYFVLFLVLRQGSGGFGGWGAWRIRACE